MIILIKHCSFN